MGAKLRATSLVAWVASFCAALLAGAIALLPSGCGPCQGTYGCPAAIIAQVDLPSGVTGPLATMWVGAPCKAAYPDGDSTGSLLVWIDQSIPQGTTKTCRVHGTLSDGTELVASVSYEPLTGCCSDLNTAIETPVTFAPP